MQDERPGDPAGGSVEKGLDRPAAVEGVRHDGGSGHGEGDAQLRGLAAGSRDGDGQDLENEGAEDQHGITSGDLDGVDDAGLGADVEEASGKVEGGASHCGGSEGVPQGEGEQGDAGIVVEAIDLAVARAHVDVGAARAEDGRRGAGYGVEEIQERIPHPGGEEGRSGSPPVIDGPNLCGCGEEKPSGGAETVGAHEQLDLPVEAGEEGSEPG